MIGRMSRFMTRFVSWWLPSPLISTTLLTLLAFVIALWLTPRTPISIMRVWGDGFWNLLAFGMQMALIIVIGHALASSAPMKSLLHAAASATKMPVQGVMLVTSLGSVTCVINRGFDLVIGAMFTREVTRRIPGSDYPLLVARAYVGFLTWGGGFSGSMPLLTATPGNPIEHVAGLIPVGDTLFGGLSIFITVALIMVMPFITRIMMPKPSDVVSIDPKLLMEEADFQKQPPKNAPLSERLEENHILTSIIGVLGIAYLTMYFGEHGFNITISTVNLMFMITGLLLHKTPMAYVRAISAAARSAAGILIRFPSYARIQLMMEHSDLGGLIAEFFINIANKDAFLVMTFSSSALISFAVPPGGGHWAIQGPFVIPAVQALGADLGRSVAAIAYGEQWMNMAQPFWALPTLAIVELGIRDIMGYHIIALLSSDVIFVVGLTPF